jgi:hypothetical protein
LPPRPLGLFGLRARLLGLGRRLGGGCRGLGSHLDGSRGDARFEAGTLAGAVAGSLIEKLELLFGGALGTSLIAGLSFVLTDAEELGHGDDVIDG